MSDARETIDWGYIRSLKFANVQPPADWPPGVRAISLKGASLLGIDDDNQLYWDGKLIELRSPLSLTPWQRIGAFLVAVAIMAQGAMAVATYFWPPVPH